MATKFNKIEESILNGINLTEGFLQKLFGFLARDKFAKDLKKAMKIAVDDPEVKASIADFQASRKRTLDQMADYCKLNPDSALCYGKFAKRYGFKFTKRGKAHYKHKDKNIRR